MAPAVKAAASGLGVVIAGPIGGAVGSLIGVAVLGPVAAAIVTEMADKFGELAGETMMETGSETMLERLHEHELGLQDAYRESLRSALRTLPKKIKSGYEEWFERWDRALEKGMQLDLSSVEGMSLLPEKLGERFCKTLELLAAQGAALKSKSLSVTHLDGEEVLPEPLHEALLRYLPPVLEYSFKQVKNSPEFDKAWKEADDFIQALQLKLGFETLQGVKDIKQDTQRIVTTTDATSVTVEKIWERMQSEGAIPTEVLRQKDAEIERLKETVNKFMEQQAKTSGATAEELERLIAAGEVDKAIALKSKQVEARRGEKAKLPADCYQLGLLYEMRFDWPKALEAYKEAWELEKNPDYGFKYAYAAQVQNHFGEAIGVYEELRKLYVDPADVAMTLNNLAILYRDTQRLQDAEAAYDEALAIRRKPAQSNQDAYLPDVAATLNNLAILYSDTQRPQDAETAYDEALAIRRKLAQSNPDAYLPDVALTLNNLAILYGDTQRLQDAEAAYDEALAIYRKLVQSNPDAYLPDVAGTLNNLAILYRATQRPQDAETAYDEALAIRRKLAQSNPDAYLPDVALTLNNLGLLYSDLKRMAEAEAAFDEALAIRRTLAEANPEVYLPSVAITLTNLANLYGDTERMQKAEAACNEAAEVLEPLWKRNPALHGDQFGRILGMRTFIMEMLGESSEAICAEARRGLEAAYAPEVKAGLQWMVYRHCGGAA